MNRFSYYITSHFIPSNKDYNFYRNPHSMYQTYPMSRRGPEYTPLSKKSFFFFFLEKEDIELYYFKKKLNEVFFIKKKKKKMIMQESYNLANTTF